MSNIRKRLTAVLCATALALTGMIALGAPAQATEYGKTGPGIVDILSKVDPNCTGSCNYHAGAGVIVSNPWSTNEVLTVDHIFDGTACNTPAHCALGTAYIYDPSTNVWEYFYLQKEDNASDLAVGWIYSNYSGGFVSAPTFDTAPLASSNPSNGKNVVTWGDHDANQNCGGTCSFDTSAGTILNNNYNGPTGTGVSCGDGRIRYNMIRTNAATLGGDSGGPVWDKFNTGDPNNNTVIGLNDCSDGPTGTPSDAIQIGWAYYDMLNTHP